MRRGIQFGSGGARARSEERALCLIPFSQSLLEGSTKICLASLIRFPFSLAQASPSYEAKSPRPAAPSGARQSRRCRCEAPYEAARPVRLEVKAACVKRAGLYRGPAKAAEVWLWGRSQQRNLSQ